MEHIRKATQEDASRIAEIYVFNNRINFYPIFKDPDFSFRELQVVPLAREIQEDKETLENTYVYDDCHIIKGFINVKDQEVCKLFVDPFFQSKNIGEKLLEYAMEYYDVTFLWALEKNTRAIQFYKSHGFITTKEKKFEEGTEEYLIKMIRY